MSTETRHFGYTYEHWLLEVDQALRFFCQKTHADFPKLNFKAGWEIGLRPNEAADQAWATIRDAPAPEPAPAARRPRR